MLPSQKKDGHFINWLPFFFVAGYGIAGTLLRAGFSDRYVSEILHLVGLSLLVLSLPKALKEKFGKVGIISEALISIAIILAFAILAIIPGSKLLSLGLSISGYALFLFRSLSQSQIKPVNFSSVFFIILYSFLSLWIVSAIWGGYHLRPTFIESLVVSKPYFFDQEFYNADTLYNLSIAHMIKNYGEASTGLDGIPSIYYHYGSHWIMAQLSKFTGIHLVHMYSFGYPLIFIPLFFHVFLQFVFQVQEWLFKKTDGGLLFLLLLMCLFIGVPNHL